MKLTIKTLNNLVFTLDVSPDIELENFKALCESEVGLPAHQMVTIQIVNGDKGRLIMNNKKDLRSFGIKEGDTFLIVQTNHFNFQPPLPDLGIDFSGIKTADTPSNQRPATSSSDAHAATSTSDLDTAQYLREEILKHPDRLTRVKQTNPRLADALLSGNKQRFSQVLTEQLSEKYERERKRIQMIKADPHDPETQKLIEEKIRQDNIDFNFDAALEYHPESFGNIIMLFIDCKVNGHPVRAFVDSGAEKTVMSRSCAESCDILRLLDEGFSGIAKGVGEQKILGRVHSCHVQISGVYLQSGFTVIEHIYPDFLLGLDMLRRHQCSIDLKRNVLIIGTTGTEIPFLSEGDLSKDIAAGAHCPTDDNDVANE